MFFEIAFKSDRFKAAGSLRGKDLSADDFSPTGSVYQSIYLHADGTPDDTCSDVSTVVGYTVNQCFVGVGYGCKFQLISGMAVFFSILVVGHSTHSSIFHI